jgi:hypothetical protein
MPNQSIVEALQSEVSKSQALKSEVLKSEVLKSEALQSKGSGGRRRPILAPAAAAR